MISKQVIIPNRAPKASNMEMSARLVLFRANSPNKLYFLYLKKKTEDGFSIENNKLAFLTWKENLANDRVWSLVHLAIRLGAHTHTGKNCAFHWGDK
jgi:hypothetical protein